MIHGMVTFTRPQPPDRTRPYWTVECAPNILIKLKRMFPKANSNEKSIKLSDSIETARDLHWFIDRYPMDCPAADYLASRSDQHREVERAVDLILDPSYVPPEIDLAIPLRPYQAKAADLAWRTKGLLLGDDVGLGKTASAIGLLAKPGTLPALVVTLTHLPKQWEAEINRFAPKLRVKIARTGKPADLAKGSRGKPAGPWDVLILNYHKLATLGETVGPRIKSVIFDEVQELRHADSAKYRAAKILADQAEFRMGLSATPIHNYGGEIHSVLDCLSPDTLGTREEFIREWCAGWEDSRPKLSSPAAFGSYLRDSGLMLRRTRSDVSRQLPPLTKITHQVEADVRAIDDVADSAAELARVILAHGGRKRGEQLGASQELSWKLRQATGIAKARSVADFVRMLAETGERVLLFGFHHAVYDLWREHLEDLQPSFYTGRETTKQKAEAIRRFIQDETRVLIMATRSGAGIDGLQFECRTVVYGELDWSPAVHHQGIGRVYRDGQADRVFAYFLTSDSGSDPVIVDILGLKSQQVEGLVNPDAPTFETLEIDPDHIKKLAADFLRRRGLPLPQPVEVTA